VVQRSHNRQENKPDQNSIGRGIRAYTYPRVTIGLQAKVMGTGWEHTQGLSIYVIRPDSTNFKELATRALQRLFEPLIVRSQSVALLDSLCQLNLKLARRESHMLLVVG
jgi:hypothetical protein